MNNCKMKRNLITTVLVGISLLSLTILGCSSDGDDWKADYLMTEYFPLASSWETDDWTLFIDVRDHMIDGVITKAMVDTRRATVYYWSNDENGLRLHGVLERDDVEQGGLRTHFYDPPIIFADDVCKFGASGNRTEFTMNGDNYRLTSELVDVADVSVPSGDFNDCLVFEINRYKLVNGTYDLNFREIWWLAKNVGLVKVVNDPNSKDSLFAGIGKARRLLGYNIAPSELTPDEQAYIEFTKIWVDYLVNENPSIAGLYSEDYFCGCIGKDAKIAQLQGTFAASEEMMHFKTPVDIVIDGDKAHVTCEFFYSGISVDTNKRWWSWARGMDHCVKEDGMWKLYGSHIEYMRKSVNVSVQNTAENGEHFAISAEFIDCETQQHITDVNVVQSLTLTGPPNTFDAKNIENYWYEDPYWRGFMKRDPSLENAMTGFYAFRVEEAGTGNFLDYTDYMQFSPSLDLPTLTFPDDNSTTLGDQLQLTWQPVERAKLYSADVNVFNTNTQTWAPFLLTDPSPYTYVDVTGLTYGADFRWRVKAMQNDLYGEIDNESISDWKYFSTPPP